jgi:hypothetical protein
MGCCLHGLSMPVLLKLPLTHAVFATLVARHENRGVARA